VTVRIGLAFNAHDKTL